MAKSKTAPERGEAPLEKMLYGPKIDTSAIVTVGHGRGFIVAGDRERFIITAGHCLPFVPEPLTFSGIGERTYKTLLGPWGESQK
jgi:hypothetical protein